MVGNDLLLSIWSGEIRARFGEDKSPLSRLLVSILTVPTVPLAASSGINRPMAFADSLELSPGLQLGDVLAEELGIDVPPNSVILLEPEELADSDVVSTIDLGRDLGRVLTSVANGALSPPEPKTPLVCDEMPDPLPTSHTPVHAANS